MLGLADGWMRAVVWCLCLLVHSFDHCGVALLRCWFLFLGSLVAARCSTFQSWERRGFRLFILLPMSVALYANNDMPGGKDDAKGMQYYCTTRVLPVVVLYCTVVEVDGTTCTGTAGWVRCATRKHAAECGA